ncbi:MAG: DUF5131 family protein, partial [Actinomycetota bacterium]
NSMSDLFHQDVPDEFIAKVFAVMAATPRHVYQVLTKRPGRMASLVARPDFRGQVASHVDANWDAPLWTWPVASGAWPLRNVWLGTSVENQKWADVRIPKLLETPAAVRFLSCEPLLGPVTFLGTTHWLREGGIGWVIVGGESGPGARPMHPDWARSLRDQAVAADVPFFFKQWGEWAPCGPLVQDPDFHGGGYVETPEGGHTAVGSFTPTSPYLRDLGEGAYASRLGKKAAGRELDGRAWNEWPRSGAATDAA